ncbi:MAG: AMP-binding protein [Bacteroidales bacterium]|nr:AMP-binding protein [Candidatus Cryptobacteroides caccocaballi]
MVKAETLSDLFVKATSEFSGLVMNRMADGSESYTFSTFRAAATSMSELLSAHGVGTGDKVAIFSAGHVNWPVAFFAATAFGRVAVPVLPEFSENEVANVLQHSESKALFASRKCLAKVPAAVLDQLSLVVELESLRIVRQKKSDVDAAAVPSLNPDDLAVLIYTSGTTGSAKGVMLTHRNFSANLDAFIYIYVIGTKDVLLSVLPLAHAYELSIGLLYPFASGSQVVYISKPPTPSYLLPVLANVKPTVMLVVPLLIEKIYKGIVLSMLRKSKFLQWMDKHAHTLLARIICKKIIRAFGGRLAFFGIGGAKLDLEVEKFLHTGKFPYFIGYGLTECAPLVCISDYHDTIPGSIGYAIQGVDVRLDNVNAKTGEGEIVVKGRNVMPGYYKDPERTAEAFNSEGWFRTKDLAVVTEDGRYFIKGRLGNMIVGASGENIYPEEIESVFSELPEVDDVIVLHRGGKLVALVRLTKEALDLSQPKDLVVKAKMEHIRSYMLKYVNAKVKAHSQISKVEFMTEPFEKTATLKIRRFLYAESAPTI